MMQTKSIKLIDAIKSSVPTVMSIVTSSPTKPKLLLHVCCAPDFAYALSLLKDDYDARGFFCNPNIYPRDEYALRLAEAKKVARIYDVPFMFDEYDNHQWQNAVDGLTDTPEGGERCRACFLLRLTRTAEICASENITSFATVMSVSPHKKISLLDDAGTKAASRYNIEYVPFDFKKRDGFKKSVALSNELGLYRQNYCGCVLSRRS